MRRIAAVAVLCVAAIGGQVAPDPITATMRLEIAVAQRDYVVSLRQTDKILAVLQAKVSAAQQACAGLGKDFNADMLGCVTKEVTKQ